MLKIQRILSSTDLSICAAYANARAAMLTSELKCGPLELLHVLDPSLPGALARMLKATPDAEEIFLKENARQEMQKIALQLKNDLGIESRYHVELGRPATRIAARADEVSADIVVVGAHGCNSIKRFFIGNTPYKLLHIGKRSLLIVKNRPDFPYQSVLVPVDFSEHSKRAAQVALAIAPNANVVLLHVFGVPQEGLMHYSGVSGDLINAYRLGAKQVANGEMRQFIASLGAGERAISSVVQFGYPPYVIQEYAERFKPDLIVMGKHGQNRVEDFLLGSVTRSTIDLTECDILITISS